MQISERIKRFLKHTNSFALILEEGKPEYLLASFDWAERALLGAEDGLDEVLMEEANKDFSLVAEKKETPSDELEVDPTS